MATSNKPGLPAHPHSLTMLFSVVRLTFNIHQDIPKIDNGQFQK
jgi:hypothetical protein